MVFISRERWHCSVWMSDLETGIYAFNPSFKEEKERRNGEVLG